MNIDEAACTKNFLYIVISRTSCWREVDGVRHPQIKWGAEHIDLAISLSIRRMFACKHRRSDAILLNSFTKWDGATPLLIDDTWMMRASK